MAAETWQREVFQVGERRCVLSDVRTTPMWQLLLRVAAD